LFVTDEIAEHQVFRRCIIRCRDALRLIRLNSQVRRLDDLRIFVHQTHQVAEPSGDIFYSVDSMRLFTPPVIVITMARLVALRVHKLHSGGTILMVERKRQRLIRFGVASLLLVYFHKGLLAIGAEVHQPVLHVHKFFV